VKDVGGECILVDPKVSLTITTTLPSWAPPQGTSATVVAKWHEFDRATRHHEGEHAEIARGAARALVALMREHRTDASCDQLNAFMQEKGKAIMQGADAASRQLDAQTRHGASEGGRCTGRETASEVVESRRTWN
jgi:predicted secreted Zn-dependent protease